MYKHFHEKITFVFEIRNNEKNDFYTFANFFTAWLNSIQLERYVVRWHAFSLLQCCKKSPLKLVREKVKKASNTLKLSWKLVDPMTLWKSLDSHWSLDDSLRTTGLGVWLRRWETGNQHRRGKQRNQEHLKTDQAWGSAKERILHDSHIKPGWPEKIMMLLAEWGNPERKAVWWGSWRVSGFGDFNVKDRKTSKYTKNWVTEDDRIFHY